MSTQPQAQTEQVIDDLSPLSDDDQKLLEEAIEKEAAMNAKAATEAGVDPTQALPSMAQMRKMLARPIPQNLLKQMKNYGGSGFITYLHWTTIKRFLDFRSPGWSYFVRQIAVTEIGVAVSVEIHVPCSDGSLIGSGVGFEPHRQGAQNKPTGFGGAPVVAERQAMKRAAAILGLGFSLYQG